MNAPAAPRALVGVSIPRSGHHYLAALLRAVLGDDLFYCEFYSEPDCCGAVPCSAHGTARFTYQKGHDLDLALPVDLPGVLYIVQYRDPVAEAVSDRELFVSATGFTTPPTDDQYAHWLAGKVRYFAGFFDKWLRSRMPQVLAIDYDRLVAEPIEVLDELCHRAGAQRTREAIRHAVEVRAGQRQQPPIAPDAHEQRAVGFMQRRVADSACFRPDLLAEYEAAVLARVPELASKRRLPHPGGSVTALSALVDCAEAMDAGDRAGASRGVAAALARWPENAYIHLAAGRLAGAGASATSSAAIAAFERAAELSPADPEILFLLADAYRGAGETARAIDVGRRIVAELPASVGHRLFYAVMLSEGGRGPDALVQAEQARHLGLTSQHHHDLYQQVTGSTHGNDALPAP